MNGNERRARRGRLASSLLAFSLLPGCLYAKVKSPLDLDLDKTQLGSKVGTSRMESVLWLFAWGDAGTKAAAEAGGIATIHHADMEVMTVLFGLYSRETTIVYGD